MKAVASMMAHYACHTLISATIPLYMTYTGCAGQIGILINYYQQPRMLPSNGGPALRFKCSVEDRITKGGGRSNLILLGVVIIFCQYSLSYILSPMCIGIFTMRFLCFGRGLCVGGMMSMKNLPRFFCGTKLPNYVCTYPHAGGNRTQHCP